MPVAGGMRLTGLLPFALACASAGPPPVIDTAAQPPPAVVGQGSGTEIRYDRNTHIAEGTIGAAVARTWQVVPRAWTDLRIPIGQINAANRTVQSGFFKPPRQMATKSIGDFLDCGYSMAGPRVTLWEVTMDVLTAIRDDGEGGTRLATTISANAKPRDGSSTGPVPCNSLGVLEKLILEQVRQRAGA